MYADKPALRNSLLPVSVTAPLEERMYRESVADVVARHSRGNHSDLQPYKPDPDAPVPYYQIGGRPLDFGRAGHWLEKKKVPGREQHIERMQFLGNDGKSNFGLMKDGGARADDPKLMANYAVLP